MDIPSDASRQIEDVYTELALLRQRVADLEEQRVALLRSDIASINITEGQQIAAVLQEERLRFERGPVVVISWAECEGWPICYVSPNIDQFGYRVDDLLSGRIIYEALIHPDDWERVNAEIHYLRTTNAPPLTRQDYRIVCADGAVRHVADFSRLVYDDAGTIVRIDGYILDVTAYKETEESLRASEARLQAIFDNAAVGIGLTDLDGHIVTLNAHSAHQLGYTPAELVGRTYLQLMHPDDQGQAMELMQQLLCGEITCYRAEKRFFCKNGDIFWADVSVTPVHNHAGHIAYLLGIVVDITDHKRAEGQLQHANERLLQSNERLRQRNHEIMLLNQLSDQLQDCRSVAEAYAVIAQSADQLFAGQSGALYLHQTDSRCDAVVTWGNPLPTSIRSEQATCYALQQQQVVLLSRSNCDSCPHLEGSGSKPMLCVPLVVRDEILGVLHLQNHIPLDPEECERWQQLAVTIARQIALALTNLILRERLQQQAIRDPLTGLHNRRYLDEILPRELQCAECQDCSVGLIMLDIDHFKRFNDTYGHDAGDTLLRMVGAFLQTHIRGSDIACRYGGEEFILLLPGASLEFLHWRAEEIRQSVQHLVVQHEGHRLESVTISIGVATFPDHGTTAEMLIKHADTALYQAKYTGRNRVVVAQGRSATNANTP